MSVPSLAPFLFSPSRFDGEKRVSLTFENPHALFLLLLLPVVYLVGRFGHAYLTRPVRNAALVVRLLLVGALVLALAQPVLQRASDLLSVVFVVDRSASVESNGTNPAQQWLAQAMGQAGSNDRVGVVDFGGNAAVRQFLGASQPVANEPTVDPQQTNLSAGLHLATSLFPSEGAHRIVVLSDGQANAGDAIAEARQDSTHQVQIDAAPIGPSADLPEVLVDSFTAPPSVRPGQPFDLNAVIQSTTASDATLRFAMDGRQLSQGTVHLTPGRNSYSVNVSSTVKGFHTFQVTVAGAKDTYAQNNQLDAFTVVGNTGHVAVVATQPDEAAGIVTALRSSQLEVTEVAPAALPTTLPALKAYDGIVLVDTPASALTHDQMTGVAAFVHDLGRGLLVVGGPTSYGLGKYDGTPLGDAMPVTGGVPGNVQNGDSAVMLVIDQSGSMESQMGGIAKMEAADQAAELAIGALAPRDEIGVVSFDTETSLVVPLQKVGDAAHQHQLQSVVSQIQAEGGTDIYAGLKAAYQQIHASSATYKHIILMSDGYSYGESDYASLLQSIASEKITLSTIAIGDDADKSLMQMLATKGGGKYYYTNNASEIPQITTKETRVVAGSKVVTASFQPSIVAPDPLIEAISGQDLPRLGGYVVTTPRKEATVVLQSDRQDPILARWYYGLGRVVAWTSDFDSQRWGPGWLGWGDFNQFLAQTMGWAMPPPDNSGLQVSSTVQGGAVDVRVDAVDGSGAYADLLDLEAKVTGANGQPVQVPLLQTQPGRYEARFAVPPQGVYPIQVAQYDSSRQVARSAISGIVVPYPAEYHAFGINQDGLAGVVALTGGSILQSPAQSFDRTGLAFTGQSRTPLWQALLAVAVLLFPIDVAIRRLRIDPARLIGRGWGRGRERATGIGRRLVQGITRVTRRVSVSPIR
jgi:Mg-chelatase subunit ChlD